MTAACSLPVFVRSVLFYWLKIVNAPTAGQIGPTNSFREPHQENGTIIDLNFRAPNVGSKCDAKSAGACLKANTAQNEMKQDDEKKKERAN